MVKIPVATEQTVMPMAYGAPHFPGRAAIFDKVRTVCYLNIRLINQVLYTLQLKMAQYRGRVKAGCGASTATRANQHTDISASENEGGKLDTGVPSENKQALLEKEEENKVRFAKYYVVG